MDAGSGEEVVGGMGTGGASEGGPGLVLPRFWMRALRLLKDGWGEGWVLRASPAGRGWMDENPRSYMCLPMVVANQWGWQVLCPTEVGVVWDGNPDRGGLRVEVDPKYRPAVTSQFGSGIVTFTTPWLFRTPPGWDLYVKGPGNRSKANCTALEGVVETWWLNYTFTLNWKLTEPGAVWFARGESLAQLVPVPHLTFEGSSVEDVPIGLAEPAAAEELLRWRARRREIADEPRNTHQLYRKGESIAGHVTRLRVPEPRLVEVPEPPAAGV